MKRKTEFKCRYCGKTNLGKMYCNASHKRAYYTKLREDRTNKQSPEDFIKEELEKPVTGLWAISERVKYIPHRIRGIFVKDFLELFDKMEDNEIRRFPIPYQGKIGIIRTIVRSYRKTHAESRVHSRKENDKVFCYVQKIK